jgi:ketosteroid isomerase-like protein
VSAQENHAIIKHIFEEFSLSQNPQPLFDAFADDGVFELVIPTDLPIERIRRGKEGLRAYFEDAGRLMEFQHMNVYDILTNDARAVAMGDERLRILASGRIITTLWVIVFQFEKGKIVAMQAFEDLTATAQTP